MMKCEQASVSLLSLMSLLLSVITTGAGAKLPVQSPVFTEPFFFSAVAPAPGPEAVNASLLLLPDCQQH